MKIPRSVIRGPNERVATSVMLVSRTPMNTVENSV